MINKYISKCVLMASSVMLLFLVGGNSPEVEIVISPEYSGAMVQVDFVKVPRSQMSFWLAKDVDEYFSPNDSFRADAVARGDVYSVYYNVPERRFKNRIQKNDSAFEAYKLSVLQEDFDALVQEAGSSCHGTIMNFATNYHKGNVLKNY